MPQERTLDSIRVDYPAPDNVPKDRKVDLNWVQGFHPNSLVDPYEPCGWLSGPDIPRLLYNASPPDTHGATNRPGHWVVTHYDDINRVYTDNELFSNRGTAEFQAIIGETFRSIPLAVDPPEHGKYRMFLMPYFAPVRLNKMQDEIRAIAVEMMDEFVDKGEVDFAWDFARVFPVRIFMNLMGFPPAMFTQFLDWEWDILHSNSHEKMGAALRGVLNFLRSFIAEKEKSPDEHLVSHIVHGQVEGRPLNEEEKIGMVWFLWLGGLDTVAATLSQMFRRMALQPEIQKRLRENPELNQPAVEEFLRTQPILSTTRSAKKDFEWDGVTIRQGDKIMCVNPSGNFDPAKFENPREFDPARKGNRHFTFVGGVHLCLGAPLARRELRIVLEEWFKRIPEFRLKPDADPSVYPGLLSVRNLPLVWDVAK